MFYGCDFEFCAFSLAILECRILNIVYFSRPRTTVIFIEIFVLHLCKSQSYAIPIYILNDVIGYMGKCPTAFPRLDNSTVFIYCIIFRCSFHYEIQLFAL